MQKPSLLGQINHLYSQGFKDYQIGRKLGIYLSRVRIAIEHIEAEKRAGRWGTAPKDLSLLEGRVNAQLAAGQISLVLVPTSSPTGRNKPRMTPTQYYEAAKQLAEENRKAHEEEEAKKAALREINPIAYVQALESEDLLDLMTHISRELSIRNGKNYPQT